MRHTYIYICVQTHKHQNNTRTHTVFECVNSCQFLLRKKKAAKNNCLYCYTVDTLLQTYFR